MLYMLITRPHMKTFELILGSVGQSTYIYMLTQPHLMQELQINLYAQV